MPWIKVSVTVRSREADHCEETLLALGAASVTLMDAHDDPVLEPAPGEVRLWDETIITGLFDAGTDAEALRQRVQATLGNDVAVAIDALEDRDWTRAWMDNFKPMRFGRRLWVVPRHMQAPDPDAAVLKLDPGLAFGTGTHPTTALCLTWLDANPPAGDVLDYGCGSGILAIAALLLGAERAHAADIDEQAIVATRSNAADNRVDARIVTCTPSGLPDNQYNLVIANILSGPLTTLAPKLATYAKPGGDIILSGILEEQATGVLAAYRTWFDIHISGTRDRWVLLHGRRKS